MTDPKKSYLLKPKIDVCKGGTYLAMGTLACAWIVELASGEYGWRFGLVTTLCVLTGVLLCIVVQVLRQVGDDLRGIDETLEGLDDVRSGLAGLSDKIRTRLTPAGLGAVRRGVGAESPAAR